jgi:hypothetical protein
MKYKGFSGLNALLNKAALNFAVSHSPKLPELMRPFFEKSMRMRTEEAETFTNALKIFDSLDLNFEFNSTEELP